VRITRLPGIHHDSNALLLSDKGEAALIDCGTSWYQLLQFERIKGKLDEAGLNRILLTSMRFPHCGGAAYLAENFGGVEVSIHESSVSRMETGDFFHSWANRFDSDMPRVATTGIQDGEKITVGSGEIEALHCPGHSTDAMCYLIDDENLVISGSVIPRADRVARWDLPTGNSIQHLNSLEKLLCLEVETLVPTHGPAIKGRQHVNEVITRHMEAMENVIEKSGARPANWPRPANTVLYHSPPSWPLEEIEESYGKSSQSSPPPSDTI